MPGRCSDFFVVRGVSVTVGYDRGVSDPVDIHLGKSVRRFRQLRSLTLSALGQAVGVSSQQMHKYENAIDRIPASRLFRIGCVLGLPVQTFFDGLEGFPEPEDLSFPDAGQLQLLSWFSVLTPGQQKTFSQVLQSLAYPDCSRGF